jgi:hypothetical protein
VTRKTARRAIARASLVAAISTVIPLAMATPTSDRGTVATPRRSRVFPLTCSTLVT